MGAQEDFEARVRRVVRRGTVYDADIPLFVSDAVQTLESLHNWRHMWRLGLGLLPAGSNTIVVGGATTNRLKNIRHLRFRLPTDAEFNETHRWVAATKVAAGDAQAFAADSAMGPHVKFWTNSDIGVGLNQSFTEDFTYETGIYTFSDMDDQLAFYVFAPGMLLSQTLVQMGPLLRDDKVVQRNAAQVSAMVAAFEQSDLVHEYEGQDMVMQEFQAEDREDMFSSHGSDRP